METFLHAVASVTIILLLTATGYFCAVKGWMTVQVKTFISRYLMTVGIPVMLIYGMQNNLTRADVLAAPRLLLIPLLVIPSCVVMSLLAGRLMKLPHRQLGVFVMMAAMGNTIFIGLAMCLELFGDIATPYVMLFYLVSSCFTQLIGIPLVRWSGEAGGFSMQMVWKFLRAPTVVSVFLSLLLVGLDIHLPSLVMSYAKYINNTVTPLALLLTGCIIHEIGLRSLRLTPTLGVMMVFRFVISPALGAALCALLGIGGLVRSVYVVELAMPVVTQTVVAAAEYGADEQLAAQGAAISTALSYLLVFVLRGFHTRRWVRLRWNLPHFLLCAVLLTVQCVTMVCEVRLWIVWQLVCFAGLCTLNFYPLKAAVQHLIGDRLARLRKRS